MTWTFRTGAAGVALAVLALAGCGGSDHSPVERKTEFGVVVGTNGSETDGTYNWKGVPFAKAPVGDLRWKAPVDPDPWTSHRDAKTFGNACVQSGRLYGPGANNQYDATIGSTLGQTLGSEDCLYLNVWQPARSGGSRPVVVFVHGGSNISGYTADPVYDGAMLAITANVVVVTVNYRLGIFGFLNQTHLKTGANANDDSGNFAMLDIIKALQFIQRNIAAFGGNPGRVTLMGESAGAFNIYAVLTSPLVVNASPALFHRLMPTSGGLSLASELPPGSFAQLYPASAYQAQGDLVLLNMLVADGTVADTTAAQAYVTTQTDAQIQAYLRSKTPNELLTMVLTRLAPIGASGSGPIPEGTVLPVDPVAEISAGHYLKVPVLAGNTRDEGKLFPSFLALSPALGGVSGRLLTDAQVFAMAFSYDPNAAPATTVEQWIPAVYLPTDTPVTGFTARSELLNQLSFGANRDSILNALKSQQSDVWYYRFDWDEEPAPFNQIYGAAHGFDLPFQFGNFGPSLLANFANTTANQPGRLDLSNAMMKSVGAFAYDGDPNNAALGVTWPTWPAKLIFDATPTAKVIVVQ
ncbi:MAG TPA: carboxylesterase family protein [Caldimonas sp.]